MPLRVSLVNLQKLTFHGCGGAGQHADVRAGAEDLVLAAGDDDRAHLRVLEAQPLHGVVELDVDAEVVGVQLQLVARAQAAVLVDVHRQRGDRAVDGEPPVPVGVRVGAELDARAAFVASCRFILRSRTDTSTVRSTFASAAEWSRMTAPGARRCPGGTPPAPASARGLLFTVLGEFVLPTGGPAWTSAFIDVLGRLGVEEKATRQALMRTAADGWLASERVGRRTPGR